MILASLDYEGTGLDLNNDRIIEVGLLPVLHGSRKTS